MPDILQDFGINPEHLFIDGQWVRSTDDALLDVLNPKDESVIARVAATSIEDADRAVAAAKRAQPKWAATRADDRGAIIAKYASLVEQNLEKLAHLLVQEQGKTLADARGEVGFTVKIFRFAAESARRIEGEILPGDNANEQIWTQRVPYGVVVGITAWNAPLALYARKVGPALVTGNTIVMKPAVFTPLTSMVLTELGRQAGIPAGVLNLIGGEGRSIGAHLVGHKHTDIISLTGSARAGEEVYRSAAPLIKPVRLELGGKAPFIVLEDADIDKAVSAAVASKYANGGTNCTANDRMYLHSAIYDEFMDKFIARSAQITVGDPMTDVNIGARINQDEVVKLNKVKARAVSEGASILLENKLEGELFEKGYWFAPTVLEVKSNDAAIMHEENFGPIVAAMKVSDYDEALSYANDSEFGLTAYVFTEQNKRIMRAVNELDFGEVYINRGNGESIYGFHTGYRKSGLGGEDGKHGIEGYLRYKSFYNNYN